ncbi:hypothetical protein MKEN_01166000 [Mycena kentingensis (nom. inval.)]|nr:hypothetical protein MKEN_01166000 [Mycena kentingensis (nom. inval.)]
MAVPNCVFTNDTPTQHEIVLIRRLLKDNASEIDAELGDRISALKIRREAAMALKSALHGSLSAIRRFPAELLCAVFLQAATPPPDDAVSTSEQRIEAPLMLGHICRRWRAVALSYCDLWSALRVSQSTDVNEIRERLARTGTTCGLQVQFNGRDGELALALTPNSALELLLTTSHRWVAIRFLHVRDYSWTAGLLHAMPQLEHIAMFYNDGASLIPHELFTSCPRLRRAQLLAPDMTDFSLSVEIPWSQLTHLRVALRPQEHFAILQNATNLVECVLGTMSLLQSDVYPAGHISMPSLRILRTEDAALLKQLTAPLLEELAVWSEDSGVGDTDVGHILPFLTRSTCALRHLALFHCKAGGDTIISLLHHLTRLETLLFEPLDFAAVGRDCGDLIRALTIPDPSTMSASQHPQVLLPALEGLLLGYVDPVEEGFRELLPMLAGRAKKNPLNMLRIIGVEQRMPQAFEEGLANLEISLDVKWIWAYDSTVVEKQWGSF